MNRLIARLTTLAFVAAALLVPASYASAQTPIWPGYHSGSKNESAATDDTGLRRGQNPNVTAGNPASIGPVWAFPRDLASSASEEDTINDSPLQKNFRGGLTATNNYGDDFFYSKVISREEKDGDGNPRTADALAWWNFPSMLPKGMYQIMIWVPSDYGTSLLRNTTQAEYTVYDDNGATTIKFDQTNGGGWVLLSSRYFSFAKAGGASGYKVELSNLTDDAYADIVDDPTDTSPEKVVIVAADAVRFVPATGSEIYSSPTSAHIPWSGALSFTDPDPPSWAPTVPYTGSFSGIIPVVYIGSVESGTASAGSGAETGSVYCINSITEYNRKITDDNWHNDSTRYNDWKRANAIAEWLGTTVWQYPRLPGDRTDELEGPIEGGIYSTPTIVETGDAVHPLVCYVAAMDRQVHALDAVTGELLWKGPGVTRSEKNETGGELTAPDWSSAVGEAFGGVFHYATCQSAAAGSPKVAAWQFDDQVRKDAGEPQGADGWSYAVYAWLPVPVPGEGQRITDATYTVTYTGASGPATSTVTVDQDDPANQGRWVRLGLSFFNVTKVTLSNVTTPPPSESGASLPESDYHVVADAVMIVPDTIDSFSYSSPVWNIKTGNDGRIFVGSTSGRVIGFRSIQYGDQSQKAGTVSWIYPAVRVKAQPGGEADMDAAPLGQISTSVSFAAGSSGGFDRLFVADFDGMIRCLVNLDANAPTQGWVFPDAAQGDIDEPEHFTSSPAVDNKFEQLFIGSTSGSFYCLNTATGRPNWRYPVNPATDITDGDVPLGAFRYSTAAVADDTGGTHRAWVGSSDGRLYSFYAAEPTNTTAERRIYTEWDDDGNLLTNHVKYYVEPTVLSPIQGSIALDVSNPTGHPYMYVGDMSDRGSLHWFRADSGISDFYVNENDEDGNVEQKFYKSYRLEGMLFSSPNLTHTNVTTGTGTTPVSYIYIGCSDGRVFAFSDENGAWGGGWSGGDWPYGPDENPQDRREEQAAPDTDVQFEMLTKPFYEESLKAPREEFEMIVGPNQYDMPPTWSDTWIVSKEMKQPSKALSGDQAIADELRTQAKARRSASDSNNDDAVFALDDRMGSGASSVYFEWGEKIYLALWNLPAKRFLYGYGAGDQSIKSNIRFSMSNSSSGSSAGSTTRPTVTITRLEEYTVLKKDPPGSSTYYEPVKEKGHDAKRCFVLAEVEFKANVPRPPSPGPGWTLTVEVRKKESTSLTSPVSSTILPIARLKAGNPPEPLWIAYDPYAGPTDPSDPSYDPNVAKGRVGAFKEQLLGVNNPLAIRDDNAPHFNSADPDGIAWPSTYRCLNERNNPDAHYNGNASVTLTGTTQTYSRGKLPTLNLDVFNYLTDLGVAHGTNSREAKLGVMDRSALGLSSNKIDNFRIDAGDLGWQGGDSAITNALRVNGIGCGRRFDWEFGLGSADYPDIPKRRQSYRKLYDEKDPTRASSTLPGVYVADKDDPYDDATMRPDTVYVTVDVPKYQPANITGDGQTNVSGRRARFGYQKTMTAYVDSDRNGVWASGDEVAGRPVAYQETYRRFKAGLRVPADPKIEVEEQLVDIGQAVHGLGEGYDFVAVNPHPDVRQWFKKITVKNAGNVNLYNLKIAKDVPLLMVRDAANIITPDALAVAIPGTEIRSSVDPELPYTNFLQPLKTDPFVTSGAGYTLTKPRVGDPDPSVLRIPDKRKWDNNFNGTQDAAKAALITALEAYGLDPSQAQARAEAALPFSTEVSVRVPISQPMGTYQAPFVPVWADLDGDNTLTQNIDGGFAEPYAAPTFQLKATVKESVITGANQPGVLPQIEETIATDPNSGLFPKVGDSTPAAYRDPETGNVLLVWSSNRMFVPDNSLYPNWTNPDDTTRADFANAPWLLNQAELVWDKTNRTWVNAGTRWWKVPAHNDSPYFPYFSGSLKQWPGLLPIWDSSANAQVMPWEFGGNDTGLLSVRHYSPVVAENPDVAPDAKENRVYIAWVGMANVVYSEKSPDGGADVDKVAQENSLFYVDASCPGEVKSGTGSVCSGLIKNDSVTIHRMNGDSRREKRHPSLAVYKPLSFSNTNNRMWMFWQSSDADRWSLYYGVNDKPGFPSDGWGTGDLKLVVPSSLASAGSPNALHRIIGDKTSGGAPKMLFDMVYDGTTKLQQTADVLLTRYAAVTDSDIKNAKGSGLNLAAQLKPSRGAQPLPRVYAEKLRRDSKFGFFTSEHIAWVRPSSLGLSKLVYFSQTDAENMLADHVGQQDHDAWAMDYDSILDGVAANSRSGLYEFYNLPHIWVVLPDKYEAGGTVYANGTVVSATDGIVPEADAATNILTYKYPEGSDAAKVFGETIADFAAGIIRFKNPLAEKKAADGSGTVAVPQVHADYTPQTWRLTTDAAVENSSRSFIERTQMNPGINPGMGSWTGDADMNKVDRLWMLWRKAATGLNSSTIFWKTYRVGIDLSKLKDTSGKDCLPVQWQVPTDGGLPYLASGDVTVNGAIGPWEVDRTGLKIYFTERDERYSSLLQTAGRSYYDHQANSSFLSDQNGDGIKDITPITIVYKNVNGQTQTVKATEISWIPEASERSLFGYATDSSVNEGSIYGFADIANPPSPSGTLDPLPSSKIWVFWTSTRQGTSDLCWATLSPSFAAR